MTRYDEKPDVRSRTDEEVWQRFKRAFDAKHVSSHLRSKKIAVVDDEVEFSHAYKNEQWHCIEPVSFDLASADSIKDKAHRWLGQLTSVKQSDEAFRVYLLLGAPQSPELRDGFRNAQNLLRKAPVSLELITEDEAETFANRFRQIITDHEALVQA